MKLHIKGIPIKAGQKNQKFFIFIATWINYVAHQDNQEVWKQERHSRNISSGGVKALGIYFLSELAFIFEFLMQ